MAQYKTPNVYLKEESVLPTSVAEVATAIPAFIGYTELTTDQNDDKVSLVNVPVRITNMSEYEEVFGSVFSEKISVAYNTKTENFYIEETDTTALPEFFLYQALTHFFANGGGACWVVSTGGYYETETDDDGVISIKLGSDGMPILTAMEKKHFSDALAMVEKVDEVTLFVMPETVKLDAQGHYDLHSAALAQASKMQDRFALIDVQQESILAGDASDDAEEMRAKVTGDLKYGAAYYPYVRSSIARSYDEDMTMVSIIKTPAIPAVEAVAAVAEVKDVDGNVIVEAVDAVAAVDAEMEAVSLSSLKESSTADYNAAKSVLQSHYLILPPSAAVAGCISKTDASRGVWKAPANVALTQVVMPMVSIDNDQQEALNVDVIAGKSVNAIRTFTGKGTLIWGARTLAGNDLEWRYVSVRRLFNMVEESLLKATAFAVFEPNTAKTWLKLKSMTENYLRSLWKQGALTGTSESEAFFVNVGLGESMTAQDILEGMMKIKIGLAASRPAEFIELTFQHKALEG